MGPVLLAEEPLGTRLISAISVILHAIDAFPTVLNSHKKHETCVYSQVQVLVYQSHSIINEYKKC